MISRAALLLLSAVPVSACVPYHYTYRPGVNGVVLDTESGAPIPSSSITVKSVNIDKSTREIRSLSNPDGTFKLPAQRSWGIYIFPADVFGPVSNATITAPGYEAVTIRLPTSALGPSKVLLGTVKLKRLP